MSYPKDSANSNLTINTSDAHSYFNKVGGALTAIVVILSVAAIAVTILMTIYAKQFYETVSNGQNNLCNFYTCSIEDTDCGFFPFTIDLEGKKICMTE